MDKNLIQLAEDFPGLNVTISLKDLLEGGRMILAEARDQLAKEIQEAKAETYLSTKKACETLGVSSTTLWRIEKAGWLHPVFVGGEKRYKTSELQSYLERNNNH
jgi:excisionase family DNA binding protein